MGVYIALLPKAGEFSKESFYANMSVSFTKMPDLSLTIQIYEEAL